jgi:hypothetical protein
MNGLPMSTDMMTHGGMIINSAEPQFIEVEKIVKVANPEHMKALEAKLEYEKEQIRLEADAERSQIEELKNIAEEKKQELLEELATKETEQKKVKENQQKLLRKLQRMEDKLITGK